MDEQKRSVRTRHTVGIVILAIIIIFVGGCVYKCQQFNKYRGEDPARAKQTEKLLATLTEPTPLTEIMAGGGDAYFIYLSPYAFTFYIPCPQFSEEFMRDLDVTATSSENISRWVSFDESGVLDTITFFDGRHSYGQQDPMPCVKLSEVYWIPGKGLEVLPTPKPWLTQV